MWRFSNQDVSSGAQVPLSVPQNGRAVGPPLLTERKFTNPSGCVALGLGFLVVAATYAVPYVIGEPDPSGGRLLFGTDYKGRRVLLVVFAPALSLSAHKSIQSSDFRLCAIGKCPAC